VSSQSRVLVIGLDPRRVPGPWDPEPVVARIETGMAVFADRGVSARACLIGLDGSDDIEAVVTDALRADAWNCVVIGGGIRHADDQVEVLELVVNAVRTHAPDATIAFNDAPETTWQAAARWLR
jgi:hypothetical protein